MRLIEQGANLNEMDKSWMNYTPLMIAVYNKSIKMIRLLINAQANLYLQTPTGLTALMVAAQLNFIEIGQMLIDIMLEAPVDPSKTPKALTEDQKKALASLNHALRKNSVARQSINTDVRKLILIDAINNFRQQNFVREQINMIPNKDNKEILLKYFESKIS